MFPFEARLGEGAWTMGAKGLYRRNRGFDQFDRPLGAGASGPLANGSKCSLALCADDGEEQIRPAGIGGRQACRYFFRR